MDYLWGHWRSRSVLWLMFGHFKQRFVIEVVCFRVLTQEQNKCHLSMASGLCECAETKTIFEISQAMKHDCTVMTLKLECSLNTNQCEHQMCSRSKIMPFVFCFIRSTFIFCIDWHITMMRIQWVVELIKMRWWGNVFLAKLFGISKTDFGGVSYFGRTAE